MIQTRQVRISVANTKNWAKLTMFLTMINQRTIHPFPHHSPGNRLVCVRWVQIEKIRRKSSERKKSSVNYLEFRNEFQWLSALHCIHVCPNTIAGETKEPICLVYSSIRATRSSPADHTVTQSLYFPRRQSLTLLRSGQVLSLRCPFFQATYV